jgi:hypothetical protein
MQSGHGLMRCDRRVHATVHKPGHTQYLDVYTADEVSLPVSAGELTETGGKYKTFVLKSSRGNVELTAPEDLAHLFARKA